MRRLQWWIGVLALAIVAGCTPAGGVTARETPARSALTILSSHDEPFLQTFRRLVGEVRNDSTTPVRLPKVQVTYYDTAGSVIATNSTYVEADQNTLQPGEVRPFAINTEVQNPARYVLSTST